MIAPTDRLIARLAPALTVLAERPEVLHTSPIRESGGACTDVALSASGGNLGTALDLLGRDRRIAMLRDLVALYNDEPTLGPALVTRRHLALDRDGTLIVRRHSEHPASHHMAPRDVADALRASASHLPVDGQFVLWTNIAGEQEMSATERLDRRRRASDMPLLTGALAAQGFAGGPACLGVAVRGINCAAIALLLPSQRVQRLWRNVLFADLPAKPSDPETP